MTNIYLQRPWIEQYEAGVRPDTEIPEDKSIIDYFDEVVQARPNSTAIIFYGKKIKFRELKDRVDRLANGLTALGFKKGDRVAFLLLNSPEYIICAYAVARIGAVLTPISPVYVSSEIDHQLRDSGAEHLICLDILYEGVEKTGYEFKNIIMTDISASLPMLKKMVGKSVLRGVYQSKAAPSSEVLQEKGITRLWDLIQGHRPEPPEVEFNPREDLFMLPYTGGTTGLPKGVMISHYNVVANHLQMIEVNKDLKDGEEVTLGFAPFYHAAGTFLMNTSILRGFTIIVLTTPDLDLIVDSAIKYRATFFLSAPTVYEMLKTFEKTDMVSWKNFKLINSGSDSLHEYTARDWERRTGTKITEAYGMTETTCVTHSNVKGRERYGSVGIPVCNTYSAVLDPDEDEYMPVGEIGEIVVEGPQITKGYWKKPDATEECETHLDGKRWWRTGDLGRMEADGYFYIYDRKRDLIKYKGLRVFAREVEEVLKNHPSIKEVGVVGQPEPMVGENVKAVVVLESDARGKISEQDLKEYCQDKLASYKIPKIFEFAGEIPKTDIGKVSRREIRTEEE